LYTRRGEPAASPTLTVSATSFLVGAALAAIWAVITDQFPAFEFPLILFGLATGIVMVLARFLLRRAADGGQLKLPASLMRAAMVVPVLVGIFFLHESANPYVFAGFGVVGLALLLLGLGGVRPSGNANNSLSVTLLVLLVFVMQYLALQFYNAVFLGVAYALYLLFAFGAAAVGAGALVLAGKTRPAQRDIVDGVVTGVLYFLTTFFLLLALNRVNSSIVFAGAAVGHVGLTFLFERLLFARPLRALAYVGLAAAVCGAVLLTLLR